MGGSGGIYVYLLSLILVMLAALLVNIFRQGGRSMPLQISKIDERLRVVEVSMTRLSGELRGVTEASKRVERLLDGIVGGMLEDYANRRGHRVDT